jgi:hypothetical protein
MILTIQIQRLDPGVYETSVHSGGVEVSPHREQHSSIAAAIRERAADIPSGFALFIEPRYAGISAGTISIADAGQDSVAAAAADRIVAVLACLKESGQA